MSLRSIHRLLNKLRQESGSDAGMLPIENMEIEQHRIPLDQGQGYLTGQLLVATPLVNGSCFEKSVIYLFSHGKDGAMGCIINHPIENVTFSELLKQVKIDIPDTKLHNAPVYFGGPVERGRGFVLHTADYQQHPSIRCNNQFAVTAVTGILQDMVAGNGPRKALLAVGYAGWQPGQLEAEIEANSWITVPATEAVLFDTPNEHKWVLASRQLGIDMAFYSHTVGHA